MHTTTGPRRVRAALVRRQDPSAVRVRGGLFIVVVSFALLVGCGGQSEVAAAAPPGPPCHTGREDNLLTPSLQGCWFKASGGWWRRLNHDLHYDSLVVNVEASELSDAQEIAQRFIDNLPRFRYLSLYVYQEPASVPGPVRRVNWTKTDGFDVLDYTLAKTS